MQADKLCTKNSQLDKNIYVEVSASKGGLIYFQVVLKLGHYVQFDFFVPLLLPFCLFFINIKNVHKKEGRHSKKGKGKY